MCAFRWSTPFLLKEYFNDSWQLISHSMMKYDCITGYNLTDVEFKDCVCTHHPCFVTLSRKPRRTNLDMLKCLGTYAVRGQQSVSKPMTSKF